MKAPHGTTIVDVSDPSRPRKLAELTIPSGVHSHKVRAVNGVMLVNREAPPRTQVPADFRGGLGIWDVSHPERPREITFVEWKGLHRFTFDGRYAYLSPDLNGYRGNIVMILDLKDPAKPEEVGRWWMPGQWIAGGETPSWEGRAHRCHHPIRRGNRLYVSYWHGGFVILDIEDMGKPRYVSGLDWSPPFPWPTHTAARPLPAHGTSDHASRRRRRPASHQGRHVVLPLARRHHRRDPTHTVRQLSGRRDRRLAVARVHRLPPARRRSALHRDPGGLVRQRPQNRGHPQASRSARVRS